MQVLLNTDTHVDGRQGMAAHLEDVVKEALHRFGDHVTRVEAHVSDAVSHAKPNPDDIVCTLEARLTGLPPVVVKDHAGTAHQAIHGAVLKLKRAVATAIEKQEDRRHGHAPADATASNAPDEAPELR
ncbi:HPF/RaiA family ribosome-associated protein [Aquabacterium sp.]|jgi:ribosome-associated translation inhibitor RaiA|uniref:HPF/RaiA family ribosome-associated protein n=1 Tax=Aquabacterium sp. TaxID=1872578 RepID=UPI0025BCBFEA|nr:HPF/RaiA family ribosome-associated protein [Aquabacterium sp.]